MTERRLVIAVLLAIPLFAASCDCEEEFALPDPPISYAPDDPAAASERLKVLFLGDGFTAEELGAYRAAVEGLIAGLLKEPPFDGYSDRLSFYRIDVVDSGGETLDGCTLKSEKCDVKKLPLAGFEIPDTVSTISIGLGVLTIDLGAELCSHGDGKCNTLGIDTPAATYVKQLALTQGPGFDAVVIVANAQNHAGSAPFFVDGDIGIAVFGVKVEPSGQEWKVSRNSVLVFSHEFGHALGLVDEEDGGVEHPPEPPEYHNVWEPDRKPWTPDPCRPDSPIIPWWSALVSGCTSTQMERCTGERDISRSNKCIVTSELKCVFYPSKAREAAVNVGEAESASTAGGVDCLPQSVDCDEWPGAFEGAYYEQVGYYRAREMCRMRRVKKDPKYGFCEACLLHLQRVFCKKGINPGSDCPPEKPQVSYEVPSFCTSDSFPDDDQLEEAVVTE